MEGVGADAEVDDEQLAMQLQAAFVEADEEEVEYDPYSEFPEDWSWLNILSLALKKVCCIAVFRVFKVVWIPHTPLRDIVFRDIEGRGGAMYMRLP